MLDKLSRMGYTCLMVTTATYPASRKETAMFDLQVLPGDFTATTCTVEALTDKGRELLGEVFGLGCVSVVMPKSKGFDFARFADQKGLMCQL